jgi:hypothetical protein
MATPGAYQLDIYRGDSFRRQIMLWMDQEKTQPADLTGVTAKAEIRDKPAGAKITPMVCTITMPNKVDAGLTAVASAGLIISKGVWDLQLTYPSGEVVTVLAGPVVVTPDVTDSTVA